MRELLSGLPFRVWRCRAADGQWIRRRMLLVRRSTLVAFRRIPAAAFYEYMREGEGCVALVVLPVFSGYGFVVGG